MHVSLCVCGGGGGGVIIICSRDAQPCIAMYERVCVFNDDEYADRYYGPGPPLNKTEQKRREEEDMKKK